MHFAVVILKQHNEKGPEHAPMIRMEGQGRMVLSSIR